MEKISAPAGPTQGILKKLFNQQKANKKTVEFSDLQKFEINSKWEVTKNNSGINFQQLKIGRSNTYSARTKTVPISPLARSKSYSRKTPAEINRQVASWKTEMEKSYPIYRFL